MFYFKAEVFGEKRNTFEDYELKSSGPHLFGLGGRGVVGCYILLLLVQMLLLLMTAIVITQSLLCGIKLYIALFFS